MFSQRKNFSVQLHEFDDIVEAHDDMHKLPDAATYMAERATDWCREKFGLGPEDDMDTYLDGALEDPPSGSGAFSQCEEAALRCMNMTDKVEYCMDLMTTAAEKMPDLAKRRALTSDEADDIFQKCAPCAFESHEDDDEVVEMCSTALQTKTEAGMFESYGMSCNKLLSEMGLGLD